MLERTSRAGGGARCHGHRSRRMTTRRSVGLATSVKPQPPKTRSLPRYLITDLGPVATGYRERGHPRPTEAEVVFQQSKARLESWSIASPWVIDSHVSWWGRHVKSTTRQVAVDGWLDHGEFRWLLTSARAVGRSF